MKDKRVFYYLSGAIGFLVLFIAFYKKYDGELRNNGKFKSNEELIHEQIASFSKIYDYNKINIPITVRKLGKLGFMLNNSNFAPIIIKEVNKAELIPKFMHIIEFYLKKDRNDDTLALVHGILYFIHDYISTGQDITINYGSMIEIMNDYSNHETIHEVGLSIFALSRPNCDHFDEIAAFYDDYINMHGYGPWFFQLIRTMMKFNDNCLNCITRICDSMNHMTKYRESWNQDIRNMACIIEKKSQCGEKLGEICK